MVTSEFHNISTHFLKKIDVPGIATEYNVYLVWIWEWAIAREGHLVTYVSDICFSEPGTDVNRWVCDPL
jgi:hypothetical protein